MQVRWDEAADEHHQAATEYARAARSTGDNEALRVLKLLEAQHTKLAAIIKTPSPLASPDHATETLTPSESKPREKDAAVQSQAKEDAKRQSPSSALAAARLNARTRDASPSLARDIASRRGIPPPSSKAGGKQPLSPAAQARARQSSPETRRRARPQIPPSVMSPAHTRPASTSMAENVGTGDRDGERAGRGGKDGDEAFDTFYASLATGTMSKLSSVLAYAGLPLTQNPSPAPPKPRRSTVPASNDPDVKQFFSPAALGALEAEHRQPGHGASLFGPAESFYVVQTGGGTYSYADITRPGHPLPPAPSSSSSSPMARSEGFGGEDDEDAFVDAREAQIPPAQGQGQAGGQVRQGFGRNRTAEELDLENSTLKSTLQELASRLSAFEAHAQDASLAALGASMASLPPHRATPANPAPGNGGESADERVKELEAKMKEQAAEHEKLEAFSRRQERKIRVYHEKWEEVKRSARDKERVRREAKAAGIKTDREGQDVGGEAGEGGDGEGQDGEV